MSFVLSGVTYSYPRAGQPALRAASLEIPAGKITVLLGPSGSGKSTLMSLLGLLWEGRLDQGEIRYDNGHMYDYARLSHVDRARLRLVEFGFVLQSAYLLPHFSCSRNIALPLELNGLPLTAARQRVEALLRRADPSDELFEARDRLPGEVSGGQKQRMAVLRAVAHNPRVVFADEPFSNLDPPNARHIVQLLLDWRSGVLNPDDPARERTLVLVCHDLEITRRVANRVALLDQGHTVVDGRAFDVGEWEDWADRIRRAFSDGGTLASGGCEPPGTLASGGTRASGSAPGTGLGSGTQPGG